MAAELIPFGEYAPGAGGEFERECAGALRDHLPQGYIVATNVHLQRGDAGFYECDAVIAAPGICDILEMKCLFPEITVSEDLIVTSNGFAIDRPFSTVDHKAKVLRSRRQRPPFSSAPHHRNLTVGSQVVVPSATQICYRDPSHATTAVVKTLADTIKKYVDLAKTTSIFGNHTFQMETRSNWMAFRDASSTAQRRNPRQLGRFAIKRQLVADRGLYEYAAVDEPPVRMEVRLREFPFDPTLPAKELDAYLKEVARESAVLTRVRHPFVSCVVGHFQTGCSWVQVSDWFEGKSVEELWPVLANATPWDRIAIFIKVIQALEFCHEKGVFHRNLTADSVWVSQDLEDVRLGQFDCALDLAGTSTLTGKALSRRDARILPPEDLQTGRSPNARLGDMFQAGVLLYRLLENGNWPFSDTLDYVTGGAQIRSFTEHSSDPSMGKIRNLAVRMMNVVPGSRPDLLSRVEQELNRAMAG